MEYTEELESLPEPEHVNQIMDGLIDTVTGVESFTSAQRYLEGVLYSNGIIRHNQVAGTEGILSKMGDGIKATIEYIKKMFRSIWDFFFKKEKKDLDLKVDKAFDVAEKDLDALQKTTVTPANVEEVLKKAESSANKIKDEVAKKKVKETIKTAHEAGDSNAKVQASSKLPEEIFKSHFLNPSISGIAEHGIKKNVVQLTKIKEEVDFVLASDVQKIINGLSGLPECILKIDGIESAKVWLSKSRQCRTAITSSLKTIENEQDIYNRLIHDLEIKMKEERGGNGKYKNDLTELKTGLSGITGIIAETKSILHFMIVIAEMVSKSCGAAV